jgi:hypothetical protein
MLPPWNSPSFSGSYELENLAGKLSLEAGGAADGGPEDGGAGDAIPVVQGTFDGSAGFLWSFVPASGGYFRIQNAGNGLFLTVPGIWAKMGAGVATSGTSPHGQGNDQWLPVANADGTYSFYNLASVMALDDPFSSTSAGTQFDQWAGNGTMAQEFTLIPHVIVAHDAGTDASHEAGPAAEGADADTGAAGVGADAGVGGSDAAAPSPAEKAPSGSPSGGSNGCTCTTARSTSRPALPVLAASLVAAMLRARRRRR